jgi:hypothetical protein
MSDNTLTVREVEVRTWPERTDVLVIDLQRAIVLAHYPLREGEVTGTVHDWTASYDDRAAIALRALERDQEYLQMHYDVVDAEIKLRDVAVVRERQDRLLSDYQLNLNRISFPSVPAVVQQLQEMPVDDLYHLLVDWYDVVERHYPAGSAALNPESWVHRAAPDQAFHWLYLASGEEDCAAADPETNDEAYDLFTSLVDVDLDAFNFGHVIRWVYFHRTEFSVREMPELRALTQTPA